MASSLEYNNESSDSIKGAESLANLRGYKFFIFNNNCSSWSELVPGVRVPNNQALTRTAVV